METGLENTVRVGKHQLQFSVLMSQDTGSKKLLTLTFSHGVL
jgi:hypothetical protein